MRMRRLALGTLGVLAMVGFVLVVLEFGARWVGFGDPVLYYNDASGGIRPLPNQRLRRLRGASVTLDEQGFRTATPEVAGAARILFLGDSVTWGGSRVDDHDLFTELAADVVRQTGTAVYAMNSGVIGSALLNQAELWDRYSDSVAALVWLFPWRDTERAYATVGALWPARFKPRFALVEVADQLLFKYWIDGFRIRRPPLDAFTVPHLPPGYEAMEPDVMKARTEKNLAAARRVLADARRRKLPIVFGITPDFDGKGIIPLPQAALDLLQEARQQGASTLDVSALIEQAPGPKSALFEDSVHFTTAGHRAVGPALGAMLKDLLSAPRPR